MKESEGTPASVPVRENFEKALERLEAFLEKPVEDDRDKAGVIQAFEFTFELCWKLLQAVAHYHGLDARSPRQALKAAFRLGIITDEGEADWLDMLDDRNLTVHTYRQETAEAIFERISRRYLQNFQAVRDKIGDWLPPR